MVGSEVTDTAGRGAGSVSGKGVCRDRAAPVTVHVCKECECVGDAAGESSARSVVSMGLSFFQDDAKSIATQHTSLQSYIVSVSALILASCGVTVPHAVPCVPLLCLRSWVDSVEEASAEAACSAAAAVATPGQGQLRGGRGPRAADRRAEAVLGAVR
jgi:hypothetical protein